MIELSSTFFVICVCGVLEASKVAVFMKGENDDEGRVLSGISLKIFSRNPIQNNDKTMKGGIIKNLPRGGSVHTWYSFTTRHSMIQTIISHLILLLLL